MSLTAETKTFNIRPALIEDDVPGTPAVHRLRQEARSALEMTGLPDTKNEDYKYTPLTRELGKNFDLQRITKTRGKISNLKPYEIPDLNADRIVVVNGEFSEKLSRFDSGRIEVSSLARAQSTHAGIIEQHLGRYANIDHDSFTAWNTAGWTDGLFIHVPEHADCKRPLAVHLLFDASKQASLAITRNLIVVGKGSALELIEKSDSKGGHPHFSNTVTEIAVGEDARLDFTIIQNNTGKHYHYGHTQVYQQARSVVQCNTFTLSGSFIRNNLKITLDGEGCEGHLYGLYLLAGKTFTDNHTIVDHRKPNSFSNELYRGVIDDEAKGVFNGKIFVRPNAQKTNAFQANRNILLTEEATIHTKPQLEIWADDVKCSHGCTSGQLDEEAMFYIQSRGIPRETARAMLLYAFVAETFSKVKDTVLKEYVDRLISDRLHKNF